MYTCIGKLVCTLTYTVLFFNLVFVLETGFFSVAFNIVVTDDANQNIRNTVDFSSIISILLKIKSCKRSRYSK